MRFPASILAFPLTGLPRLASKLAFKLVPESSFQAPELRSDIISRLSRASRLSAPQPAGSPISQLLKFSPLTPERGLEPVTGI